MRLHKSCVAAMSENKELQEFTIKAWLDYKVSVKEAKSKTAKQFFDDFFQQKMLLTQRHKENFLGIKVPASFEEKTLILLAYYPSFILFPDEEIKKRLESFNFPNYFKYFTPVAEIFAEFDQLIARGYEIDYFAALTCAESILFTQGIYEAAKATGFLEDYREATILQSRRKKPFAQDVVEELSGNSHVGRTLKDLYDLNIAAFGTEQKSILKHQKKMSAGHTSKMTYRNLQNSIVHPALKQSEYFRNLVNLTTLLTKKEPHSEDSFLDSTLKRKNYNSYLSDFVKKIWLKK